MRRYQLVSTTGNVLI